ncbi:N-(5'-phosphoribosyl)anthranilate isomerase [Pseudoroseomonas deserti]|jgi:phosphoribosylanthranilate isomerase|uniref:N-(5'-phosphoribosyl)anthranilate isomerase n=1 Tax=Teichococcus deserti TaxID=1817963 RepID=A0A1V2GZ26_9PROT|nr:phosphoribosylanthranilate isomerase [Pseudoroseomonas deserti]ONG50496.1 N-(5'-phosphoribosyl)anthranilate isomerase [Pseudoroseomonas deserti]
MPHSLPRIQVKVCGINDGEAYDAACRAGADMVGFVFFPPSPRYVTPEQAAELAGRSGTGRRPLAVGLFVDPDDALIAEVLEQVPLGLLQLHGEETPERCAAIRERFGLPVMKVLGIATDADLALIEAYAPVVDRFLLDAKAPPGASLPGGNAVSFDWTLLAGRSIPKPWMLAGGLTPLNVAQAIRASGTVAVDASSGLERMRGVKDPVLIAAFIAAAHSA